MKLNWIIIYYLANLLKEEFIKLVLTIFFQIILWYWYIEKPIELPNFKTEAEKI